MASPLFERVRSKIIAKLDLKNDEDEAVLKAGASATLTLSDAIDTVEASIGEDADLNDMADALLDLAVLVDGVKLTTDQRAQLDSIVNRLVKTGDDDQKKSIKSLFFGMLDYQNVANSEVAYFDALRAQVPPTEPPAIRKG